MRDLKDLPRKINEAFLIAMTGRPGPVLVDLPKDVSATCSFIFSQPTTFSRIMTHG